MCHCQLHPNHHRLPSVFSHPAFVAPSLAHIDDAAVPNNMHDGHNVSTAAPITSTTPMEAGRTAVNGVAGGLPTEMPAFCDRCRQDGGEPAKPMAIRGGGGQQQAHGTGLSSGPISGDYFEFDI